MKLERVLVVVAMGLLSAAGCGGVMHSMHSDHTGQRGTTPSAVRIEVAPIELTLAPTSAQLTAFLCPLLAADAPLSTPASAACRSTGPAPSADALAVNIHVDATMTSSNPMRLTASSALLVVTAYPGTGAAQVVGAVCLTLCDEGAASCPQTDEACRTATPDVIDLGDVAATSGFLTSVAVADHRYEDLAVREIPAHGEATLRADLAMASAPLLAAIQANDTDAVAAIRAGHAASFTVPYAIEGTVWVEGRGNDGFAEPIARSTGTITFPSN